MARWPRRFVGRAMGVVLSVSVALPGCRSRSAEHDRAAVRFPARDAAPAATLHCRSKPLAAAALPLAEASGATWVPAAGDRPAHLLVVGDSGNRGEFNEVDLETGEVLARGRLPLDDGASDDLEGLSRVGDTFYAVTSSGWVRHFQRGDDGYHLTQPAYPLAPPPSGSKRAALARAMVCADSRAVNCGRNYEGLCLYDGRVAAGRCAGFVAAKTSGVLFCLVRGDDGRLAVDPRRGIAIAPPETLSGCAFAPDGDVLWAGTNLLAANAVFAIRGWPDPEAAEVTLVGRLGPGFAEAIAVAPGGILYRLSDTGGAPSSIDAHICE